MRLLTRRKTPIEELKDAAIEVLANALDNDTRAAKPGMQGVRALATGAVIYTAARAAFKGQRFVREQLSSDTEGDRAEDLDDEEETRAYEEPEASEDHDEPEAQQEPDDESSSETPAPLPERKPVRRAARKEDAQPSLELPRQRRARTWVSKD